MTDAVLSAVDDVLDRVGRHRLEAMQITPVSSADLDTVLAQLDRSVAPAFLPIATDDQGTYALHLLPGRPALASPWVYIDRGEQQANLLASAPKHLARCLFLFPAWYMRDRDAQLVVLRELATEFGGPPPDEGLVARVHHGSLPRWSPEPGPAQDAWAAADPGNPFVTLPEMPRTLAKPPEALPELERSLPRTAPELIAILTSTRARGGEPAIVADSFAVLRAEAWRCVDLDVGGRWRSRVEPGLALWHGTRQGLSDDDLRGTPFEALIGRPDAYSGDDPQGPDALFAVADAFLAAGEPLVALAQARNAVHVARIGGIASDRPPFETVARMADAATPDLAGALARRVRSAAVLGP